MGLDFMKEVDVHSFGFSRSRLTLSFLLRFSLIAHPASVSCCLRTCGFLTVVMLQDQKAALGLVSARPSTVSAGTGSVEAVRQRTAALLSGTKDENDPDLQRAKDLVELHYAVKVKHLRKGTGVLEADDSLEDARHAVKVALEEMGSA